MRNSAAPYGQTLRHAKKARRTNPAGEEQLARRLEPEGKSEANNAVAQSIAHHIIGHAGIGETNKWGLLAPGKTGIFYVGIDALEVGVIEHVLESRIEFQAGAFVHFDVFKQTKIGDVGYGILR